METNTDFEITPEMTRRASVLLKEALTRDEFIIESINLQEGYTKTTVDGFALHNGPGGLIQEHPKFMTIETKVPFSDWVKETP